MPQSLATPQVKQFKTHSEQIALLRERGMLIESDSKACRLLDQVNYYRLSGYWYSWRKLLETGERAGSFIAGTTLADVVAVYMFDCKLREAVFTCLAPIELSVRFMLGHELGHIGSFAHRHPDSLGSGVPRKLLPLGLYVKVCPLNCLEGAHCSLGKHA